MVLASLKSIFFSVEMYITLTFGLALPLYCSAISTALKWQGHGTNKISKSKLKHLCILIRRHHVKYKIKAKLIKI